MIILITSQTPKKVDVLKNIGYIRLSTTGYFYLNGLFIIIKLVWIL